MHSVVYCVLYVLDFLYSMLRSLRAGAVNFLFCEPLAFNPESLTTTHLARK